MKEIVEVSHEMTALVGAGALPLAPLPLDPVIFAFSGFDGDDVPVLEYRSGLAAEGLEDAALVFIVARAACQRLYAGNLFEPGRWHMVSAIREQAGAILACEGSGETRTTLRLARSIELLCRIHFARAEGLLVPVHGDDAALGELDRARIAAARRMLDDGWRDKLTIADLARRCGINRDKLVRGFRQAYGSTIAGALSERRLGEARTMLLTSDLPVSSIGYACGYLNNASFTRAFARRFGAPPTELRRMGIAA